jgi:hypothetical protein
MQIVSKCNLLFSDFYSYNLWSYNWKYKIAVDLNAYFITHIILIIS